jgi:phospholipid transport system substrate-binding protein
MFVELPRPWAFNPKPDLLCSEGRPPVPPCFGRLAGEELEMSTKIKAVAALAVFLTAVAVPLCRAQAATASDVIRGLNDTFIEVMQKGPELGYAGRFEKLRPALSHAYDFPSMARVSTGRYWSDLDDAQKVKVIDAFERYSAATYAARFTSYSGQSFEILGEQPAARNTTLVKNRIVRSNGEAVRIDYLMLPKDGAFKIVDVYLKSSISELSVRRSEFTSIIAKQGFDGLIATLEKKIAALEREGSGAD